LHRPPDHAEPAEQPRLHLRADHGPGLLRRRERGRLRPSLFLQTGQRYSPGKTSLALLPMTIGILLASAACAALISKLGRILVLIGLLITIAGAGGLLAIVTTTDHPIWWQLSLAILVIGLGMGTCTGTIFDTALGDVAPDEAGSASGSISAIEQLA